MFAKFFFRFYLIWHGRLHWAGAGWLMRRMARSNRDLQSYPMRVPGFGTAILDFRDIAAFGLLNTCMGESGDDTHQMGYIQRCLTPGAVLWDVGANVGYFSLAIARLCPDLGAIHAFEPNPGALQTLRSLFENHSKLTVHPVGLGSADQVLELSALPSGTQTGSLVRPIAGATKIKIPIRRGDDYAHAHSVPDPDVVKIDVEGFEAQVFAGLPEMIARKHPVIFFEHHFLTDPQIREAMPPGYTLRFILKDGRLSSEFADRHDSSDCVLLPPGRADLLKA